MSGSPRVEVPSARERGPGTPLPGAPWERRAHLPPPAYARMQQVRLDAHLCSHDHTQQGQPGTIPGCWAGSPGHGEASLIYQRATADGTPKDTEEEPASRGCSHPHPLRTQDVDAWRDTGCVNAAAFGPELTLSWAVMLRPQ